MKLIGFQSIASFTVVIAASYKVGYTKNKTKWKKKIGKSWRHVKKELIQAETISLFSARNCILCNIFAADVEVELGSNAISAYETYIVRIKWTK